MTIGQFREEIIETELSYEFLRDCLEYVASFGILTELYCDLKLNKYEDIDELLKKMPSKQEAGRAVYFGNIQNWYDDYFYLDGAGNIRSENQYQYEQNYIENKKDIMYEIIEFIDSEDFKEMKNVDEVIKFIKTELLGG